MITIQKNTTNSTSSTSNTGDLDASALTFGTADCGAGAALAGAIVSALPGFDSALTLEDLRHQEFMEAQNRAWDEDTGGISHTASDAASDIADILRTPPRGFAENIKSVEPPKSYAGFVCVHKENNTWLPRELHENRQRAKRYQARLPHRRPWPDQRPKRFGGHVWLRRSR